MKAPTTWYGQFSLMFVSDLVAFLIICANMRAVAMGSYRWTLVTDLLFGVQASVLGKLMIDDPNARSWWAMAGGTIGGVCGSMLSIYLTKVIYGK